MSSYSDDYWINSKYIAKLNEGSNYITFPRSYGRSEIKHPNNEVHNSARTNMPRPNFIYYLS